MRKTTFMMLLGLMVAIGSVQAAPPQAKTATTQLPRQLQQQRSVSRAQLLVYKNVYAAFGPDFAYDGLKLTVTAYTFVLVPKHGQAYIEQVKGNQLTSNIREKIRTAKPGDMILLTNVNVTGEMGEMTLDGPTITVY